MTKSQLGRLISLAIVSMTALGLSSLGLPAQAATYVPITGTGSTWSQNALDQWRKNVAANYGMTVNYSGTGSSAGRRDFLAGSTDFGVSEIPFQLHPTDGSQPEVANPPRPYAYMPIVAGGTSFMYNLKIGGQRVTNLRLAGDNITKIFTGVITNWNDPAIAKDNPKLVLPNKPILPVVRSDGSGTSAQFTLWMSKQYPSLWNNFCKAVGLPTPCGLTSQYPAYNGFKAQSGSNGVAGYVSQDYGEGAITYVEYSYALKAGFPVVKVLNKSGYYTEPTAKSVAVALLQAKINTDSKSDAYLTQILDGVYNNPDPRTYPISSYSYMIVPTAVGGVFTAQKGATLGTFAHYMLCEGQQQADALGYSPLPMNLVLAGFDQIKRIPGANDAANTDAKTCNNPTFKAGDSPSSNQLAKSAPMPAACDKQGADQCATGTGGSSSSNGSNSSSNSGSGTTTDGTGTNTGGTGTTDNGSGGGISNGGGTGGTTSNGSDSLSAYPYTLPDEGFGQQQITMLVAGILLVISIIAPPLAISLFKRRTPDKD